MYQELLEHKPHGVTYVNKQDITSKKYYNIKSNIIKKIASTIGMPRVMKVNTDADLIHSSRGIIPIGDKPYVLDLEHPYSLTNLNYKSLNEPYWRNLIKRLLGNDRCKRIMMHCKASEVEMLKYFPSLKDKIEVVYPASSTYSFNRIKYDDRFKVLFVGAWKLAKGGVHLEKAIKMLKDKYDIDLIMHTDYAKDSSKILKRKDMLKKYHAQADLFVYPSMLDTFGYGLLDAMSVRLPIITTDIYAIPEIVEHAKTGYIIHSPTNWTTWQGQDYKKHIHDFPEFAEEIKNAIEFMMLNTNERKKMSDNAYSEILHGKFSIKERNKKLFRIYHEALE
jgi:glycosyltransferase involved in cell wall biosynthesis